jgi:hypothetical protein
VKRCRLWLLVVATCLSSLWGQQQEHVVRFTHVNWFDGVSFHAQTWYSVNGFLRSKGPSTVNETIDLKGMFVVPACGEAHNHSATGDNPTAIDSFLSSGIPYVENPGNLPRVRTGERINTPDGVDVIFSNGLLTAPGGHPLALVQRNIERGGIKPGDGEGGFYYTIASPADLEQKWPKILATKPDFIKTVLAYSEEFEQRKADPKYFSQRGLDPTLLPLIVQKAEASHLWVAAHIWSAADFPMAVSAGVHQIAHMPGFGPSDEAIASRSFERYRISEADARLAGKKHIQVTTTLGEGLALARDPKSKDFGNALLDVHKSNLLLLKKNKVEILIGSDQFSSNSRGEALELVRSGLMSAQEVLRGWCEVTPQAIFPGRKIGKAKNGYEANLMVLPSDPLADFTVVKDVKMTFKRGVEIKVH